MKVGEFITGLIIPLVKQGSESLMSWIRRNFQEIIMTSLVIFIELFLNALTAGGDLGIPPLSIGLGLSLITLYCAPLTVTAVVGTIVTYLLIDLHSEQSTQRPGDVTPKKRIQRRLDGWSPLGIQEIEEENETDIQRLKDRLYTLSRKLIINAAIIGLCGLMVYSLQGCDSGEDVTELDYLMLAYTILTYTEGIRMIVVLLIGIILGNT